MDTSFIEHPCAIGQLLPACLDSLPKANFLQELSFVGVFCSDPTSVLVENLDEGRNFSSDGTLRVLPPLSSC